MDDAESLPEGGPGLHATGKPDPTGVVAIVAAVLSLVPTAWVRSAFQAHAFGPIEFAVILAIVAVLFGFVAIMRSGETKDRTAKLLGIAAVAIGLVRILLYPILGL